MTSVKGLSDLLFENWLVMNNNERVRNIDFLNNLTYTGLQLKSEWHGHSYFCRVSNIWNKLSVDIKAMDLSEEETNTISVFKKCLKKFLGEKIILIVIMFAHGY